MRRGRWLTATTAAVMTHGERLIARWVMVFLAWAQYIPR